MGRVRALSLPGIRCWIYSGDHGPPHFHAAVPAEWELRVFFLEEPVRYEVKYEIRRVPGPVLNQLLRAAQASRAELFREWDRSQPDG